MNIDLYNRAFLREQGDAPPWIDSSFMKNHSFIFPGDELVLYHNVNLPGDLENVYGTLTVGQVKLVSVTMSIIAKKPNIFTGVFSRVFKASRQFVLDSATVILNAKNAPVISWCEDGYAPNMNYKAPRNWKLPPTDFRRQLNLFTSHTSGTSEWIYWFYFPILFRWEYWKNLPGADGDFVNACGFTGSNTGTVQNNQTQNWTNYVGNPAWEIHSQLQLNLLVNGEPTTITSDLKLNRTPTSIQTYNSNPDFSSAIIKTCAVGGIPIQTPAPLFTDQNTSVFAQFTKVSAWGYKEQANIVGFITIEIFQGAGATQRLRATSACAVTPESCFINLYYPILNDDGTPLLNDTNDPVLHDAQGVALAFNGQTVQMEAQIDYNKLNTAFPNATGFNITARLYNKTVYLD